MTDISRRKFLFTGGAGAAAFGTMALLPSLDAAAAPTSKIAPVSDIEHQAAVSDNASAAAGFAVYIPNPKSGEIHYMIGETEIVRRDKSLVTQMLRNAK